MWELVGSFLRPTSLGTVKREKNVLHLWRELIWSEVWQISKECLLTKSGNFQEGRPILLQAIRCAMSALMESQLFKTAWCHLRNIRSTCLSVCPYCKNIFMRMNIYFMCTCGIFLLQKAVYDLVGICTQMLKPKLDIWCPWFSFWMHIYFSKKHPWYEGNLHLGHVWERSI